MGFVKNSKSNLMSSYNRNTSSCNGKSLSDMESVRQVEKSSEMAKGPSGGHHEDMLIPGNRGDRERQVCWLCRPPVAPGDTGHALTCGLC